MVIAPSRFTSSGGGGGPFTSSGQFGLPDNAKTRSVGGGTNEMDLRKITTWAGAAPTIQSIELLLGGSTVSGNLIGVIYSDSAGAPGTLLGTTSQVSVIGTTDNGVVKTMTFASPILLAAATSYWIGYSSDVTQSLGSWFNGPGIPGIMKWVVLGTWNSIPGTAPAMNNWGNDSIIVRANVTVDVGVAGWWDHDDTNNDWFLAANQVDLTKITIPGACTLDSITLGLSSTVTVGGKMKAVIYPDSSGSPASQSLAGTGSEVTVASANTELVSTFSGVTLSAGDYWIGCIEDNSSHLKGWGSSNVKWKGGAYTYPTPPNPAPGTVSGSSIQPKIYALFH